MAGNTVLERIKRERIVAIARGVQPEDMAALADALLAGGIGCIEFTMDHSGRIAPGDMLNALAAIRQAKGDAVAVGVGTVLTPQQVRMSADAGAQFVLSPDFSPEVVEQTKSLGLVSIPGAMTPSEIVQASGCGADIVKLFPAGSLGSNYLRSIRGPLPHIPLSAVGGISAGNAAEFLAAGADCLGVGGRLVDLKAIAVGDFAAITAAARELVEAVS